MAWSARRCAIRKHYLENKIKQKTLRPHMAWRGEKGWEQETI